MCTEKQFICDCVSCIFEELKKCKMNIEKLTEESRNILDKIAEFYKTDIYDYDFSQIKQAEDGDKSFEVLVEIFKSRFSKFIKEIV